MKYNQCSEFNVLVPFRHGLAGKVLVNKNDAYMYGAVSAYGEYSEGEVDVFRALVKETDLVLDIGACMGLHTLALCEAAKYGTVVAIEPQRLAYQTLCANMALNSVPHADCLRAAVSDATGMVKMPQYSPYAHVNMGGVTMDPYAPSGDATPVVTVDALELGVCGFMKIDVEGMEANVIRGALKTIEKLHPLLYLEFQWNKREIVELLRGVGYPHLYRHYPLINRFPNFLNIEIREGERPTVSPMLLASINEVDSRLIENLGLEEIPALAGVPAVTGEAVSAEAGRYA